MQPSRGKDFRDKSWIPGPFTCVVKNAREMQGRNGSRFYSAELEDPENPRIMIEATADIDFTRLQGDLVEITGSGISREEYQGNAQLKMGRKAEAHVISSKAHRAPTGPPSRPDTRAAGGSSRQPPAASAERPYGPAIGNALDLATRCILDANLATPGTPEFVVELLGIASDIMRVNAYMAAGHLAPKAVDREKERPRTEPDRNPRDREPDDHLPGDPPDERPQGNLPIEDSDIPF